MLSMISATALGVLEIGAANTAKGMAGLSKFLNFSQLVEASNLFMLKNHK